MLRNACLSLLAKTDQFTLLRVQEVGIVGIIGEVEPADYSEDDRWETFDDQDPSPARVSSCSFISNMTTPVKLRRVHTETVHETNSVSEKTSDRTSNGCGDEEVRRAECKFVLGVEEGQVDHHAGEQTCQLLAEAVDRAWFRVTYQLLWLREAVCRQEGPRTTG